MSNQEDHIDLKGIETEAFDLRARGNVLGALEVLDKAMEIEERWYNFYAKASWLYDLPEKSFDETSSLIQEGFSRFPDKRFWFLYLRARLRHYEVVRLAATSQQNLELSVSPLLEAQKDINLAMYELRERAQIIQATVDDPPLFFAL